MRCLRKPLPGATVLVRGCWCAGGRRLDALWDTDWMHCGTCTLVCLPKLRFGLPHHLRLKTGRDGL